MQAEVSQLRSQLACGLSWKEKKKKQKNPTWVYSVVTGTTELIFILVVEGKERGDVSVRVVESVKVLISTVVYC